MAPERRISQSCFNCGADCDRSARYCPACGVLLSTIRCTCGATHSAGMQFCASCGRKTDAVAPKESAENLELRPLTVMFVDMVESTALAQRLGPEDYRALLRAMRFQLQQIVQEWGGYIADYAGDGALVLFGYPKATRNHAYSAVSCGLKLLSHLFSAERSVGRYGNLELRVGCHTGVAIVDDRSADGVVLAIASRLQSEAVPGTVLISKDTKEMTDEYFLMEARGPRRLKGLSFDIEVFQVNGARPQKTSAWGVATSRLSPTVGRRMELAMLRHHWARCSKSSGCALLVTGEAGIGKSRLVNDFLLELGADSEISNYVVCDERYKNTPFWPFANIIESASRRFPNDPPIDPYRLSIDTTAALDTLRQVTFGIDRFVRLGVDDFLGIRAAIVEYIRSLNRKTAIVIDDVHWCDPSSRELLRALIADISTMGVFLLLTGRSDSIEREWFSGHLSVVHLQPLDSREVGELARNLATASKLDVADIETVVARSDGIPLFVEEVVRTYANGIRGSQQLHALPDRLQGVIWERLDRLEGSKRIAQLASVIGRTFSPEILRLAVDRTVQNDDETSLEGALRKLQRREVFVSVAGNTGRRLAFRHALIQEAAYESIPLSVKRHWHGIVADTVEDTRENDPTYFEVIAKHRSAAGQPKQAASAYCQAGNHAVRQFANSEAIELYGAAALEAQKLPNDLERAGVELEARRSLCAPILARHGWAAPEFEGNANRLLELALFVDELGDAFEAHRSLLNYALLRADGNQAVRHLAGMSQIANRTHDRSQLATLYRCIGANEMFIEGNMDAAYAALLRSLEDCQPIQNEPELDIGNPDGEVTSRSLLSWLAWFSGDAPRAIAESRSVFSLAETSEQPFGLACAYCVGGSAMLSAGELEQALEISERARAVSEKWSMRYWAAYASVLRGGSMVKSDPTAALNLLEDAKQRYVETGASLIVPWIVWLQARAYLEMNQHDAADRIANSVAMHEAKLFRGLFASLFTGANA